MTVHSKTKHKMESNKMCRICLSKKCDMEDIFNVVDVIQTIAPIKLEKEDGLPSTICSDCLSKANQAYIFRLLCIESDATVRYMVLSEVEKESEVVSSDTDKNLENDMEDEDDSQINYEEVNIMNSNNNPKEIKIRNKMHCSYCDTQFDNRNVYIEHKQNHLKELKCNICGKIYPTRQKFTKHIYMHKQKGSFLCNTCGKVFTRVENLKIHGRIHSGIKPHKCSLCSKSFTQSNELKYHILSHTKEKAHLCSICGVKFSRSGHLKDHVKRKHLTSPDDERPFVCGCGKSFREKGILNSHQKSVHTIEHFACQLCNKEFNNRKHLIQHEIIHKKFVYSLCE